MPGISFQLLQHHDVLEQIPVPVTCFAAHEHGIICGTSVGSVYELVFHSGRITLAAVFTVSPTGQSVHAIALDRSRRFLAVMFQSQATELAVFNTELKCRISHHSLHQVQQSIQYIRSKLISLSGKYYSLSVVTG